MVKVSEDPALNPGWNHIISFINLPLVFAVLDPTVATSSSRSGGVVAERLLCWSVPTRSTTLSSVTTPLTLASSVVQVSEYVYIGWCDRDTFTCHSF